MLMRYFANRARPGVVEGGAPAQFIQEVFPHEAYLSAQEASAFQGPRLMLDTNIRIYAIKNRPEKVLKRFKRELNNGICVSLFTG